MIVNSTVCNRKYGALRVSVARRRQRQSAVANLLELLATVDRTVVISCCAVVFGVVCCSQFLEWQAGKVEGHLEKVSLVQRQLNDQHIVLRSKRAQLMSEKHIQAIAGARLELFVPNQGQVHKM